MAGNEKMKGLLSCASHIMAEILKERGLQALTYFEGCVMSTLSDINHYNY
jgi:hypothetical protein